MTGKSNHKPTNIRRPFILLLLMIAAAAAFYFQPVPPVIVEKPVIVEDHDPVLHTPVTDLAEVPTPGTYEPIKDDLVRIGIDHRPEWAPLVLANQGTAQGRVWATADGREFLVELVYIDDPVALREALIQGDIHAAGAVLNALPFFMAEPGMDPRSRPRVFDVITFGQGADALVSRRSMALDPDRPMVRDLRGKRIVIGQNSPSLPFLLHELVMAGLDPAETNILYTRTPEEALEAFLEDRSIAACAGPAPKVYTLLDKPDCVLLALSGEDRSSPGVLVARADFSRDRPEILAGLVKGTRADSPAGETSNLSMFIRPATCAASRDLLLGPDSPGGLAASWREAETLYHRLGFLSESVPLSSIIDHRAMATLDCPDNPESAWPDYRSMRAAEFNYQGEKRLAASGSVYFEPGSARLVDEGNAKVLDEAAAILRERDGREVAIIGHTDGARQGKVSPVEARYLSSARAKALAEALSKRVEGFSLKDVTIRGASWHEPADPKNRKINRRAEIYILVK